jgi:excisionase family DNA binding protein
MGRHLTTAELASWLRVTPDRIRALVRTGTLPARRLTPRGRLLFDEREVEQALASAATTARPDRASAANDEATPAA